MTLTADEQKALEHIRQERRREGFQRQLQAKLIAPVEPAASIKKGFAPLTITGRIRGQSA